MSVTEPAWTTAFLICKDCKARSSGPPKKLKPKKIAAEIKRVAGRERPRSRILLTSCLGLCPRGAQAIAHLGGPRPLVAGLASMEAVADFAASCCDSDVTRQRTAETQD